MSVSCRGRAVPRRWNGPSDDARVERQAVGDHGVPAYADGPEPTVLDHEGCHAGSAELVVEDVSAASIASPAPPARVAAAAAVSHAPVGVAGRSGAFRERRRKAIHVRRIGTVAADFTPRALRPFSRCGRSRRQRGPREAFEVVALAEPRVHDRVAEEQRDHGASGKERSVRDPDLAPLPATEARITTAGNSASNEPRRGPRSPWLRATRPGTPQA